MTKNTVIDFTILSDFFTKSVDRFAALGRALVSGDSGVYGGVRVHCLASAPFEL